MCVNEKPKSVTHLARETLGFAFSPACRQRASCRQKERVLLLRENTRERKKKKKETHEFLAGYAKCVQEQRMGLHTVTRQHRPFHSSFVAQVCDSLQNDFKILGARRFHVDVGKQIVGTIAELEINARNGADTLSSA